MLNLLLLLVLTGVIESAPASSTDYDPVRWIGTAELGRRVVLLELSTTDPAAPTLDVYSEAPNGFDYPIARGIPLAGLAETPGGFHANIELRGTEFNLDAERHGDIMALTFDSGTSSKPTTSRLVGLPAHTPGQGTVTGLYGTGEDAHLVTWREFGGLRLIRVSNNTNTNLYELGERRFLVLGFDSAPGGDDRQANFIRGKDGIVALRLRGADRPTLVLPRRDELEQRRVQVDTGDHALAGTAFMPAGGPAPRPGLVLVHGSGPIYRTALAARAARLASMGLTVLAYDKRGTGASGGALDDDDFRALASDAAAVLAHLETMDGVDPARTGFQGHSQAGYVIPIAAGLDDRADFAIVVNGGSVPPGEQSLYDKRNDLEREGFSGEAIEAALALMRDIHGYVLAGKGPSLDLQARYRESQGEPWFPVTDLPRLDALPEWSENPEPLRAYQSEIGLDPVANQSKLHIPVLVLLGNADRTVPPRRAAEGWRQSAEAAGNEVTVRFIEGAGHGMRRDEGTGTGPIVDAYWRYQKEWLAEYIDLASE